MILFFLRKAGVSLGVSILSCILIISSGFYAANHHHQIKELKHHLLFLNHQAVRSQEAVTLIKAHEKDFAAFQSSQFEKSFTPEMLQSSIHYVIEFGQISRKNPGSPISQELSFSIPCLQDRDTFILLDHLLNEGPGFFQIHDVTIHRTSALSEEMLEKIAAGLPQALFDGKVTATWVHH